MVDQKIVDQYADMDIDELEFELEDLYNAIDDRENWLQRDYPLELKKLIEQDLKKLQIEAAHVRKLVREAK